MHRDDGPWQNLHTLFDDGEGVDCYAGRDVHMVGDADSGDTAIGTDEYVVPDLHGVVLDLAARDAGWGFEDGTGGDDGAAAY